MPLREGREVTNDLLVREDDEFQLVGLHDGSVVGAPALNLREEVLDLAESRLGVFPPGEDKEVVDVPKRGAGRGGEGIKEVGVVEEVEDGG